MAPTKKNLLDKFDDLPSDTKSYLSKLRPILVDGDQYDIALAYVFMKLEEGNHRALKCGAIRRLKCTSGKVDEALQKQHFTRDYYKKVFRVVLGKDVPTSAQTALTEAEKIRDKQIHGKSVEKPELRTAVADCLTYVSQLGEFVKTETGKNPFGDLRGLVGRKELLDTATSYLVLKGCGLFTENSR